MTPRTRNIIANALLVLSILFLAVFVGQHFMTPPRPSWHKSMVSWGLICVIASGIFRGREGRLARRNVVANLSLLAIIVVLLTFVA